jgi:hypothetical protein
MYFRASRCAALRAKRQRVTNKGIAAEFYGDLFERRLDELLWTAQVPNEDRRVECVTNSCGHTNV